MANNRIYYGSNLLIDLSSDTVTADKLVYGYTAHDRDGEPITGTNRMVNMDTLEYDYNIGYVAAGTWNYENPTRTYTDIYEVQAGHKYIVSLGANVGSRFRSMFTTVDIRTKTSGSVTGTQIINQNNPAAYANASYTAQEDGYILVAKDNVGKTGIHTYVYDTYYWS